VTFKQPNPIHLFEVGGVFFLTLIIQKQATHGTQSMGFENILQPNLNDVFCFRVFPCSSVAILLLPLGLYSVFFRGRITAIERET